MDKRIIVALDFPTLEQAARMSETLGDQFGYKVGMELNTAAGTPRVLESIGAKETFLDLKYHDIPNTVASAVRAAALQGVWMLNVHVSGGIKMMDAAAAARDEIYLKTGHCTLVIGVTMLTSLDEKALEAIGIYNSMPIPEKVRRLAEIAWESNLDGVVCSPEEIAIVRKAVPDERRFKIVTPGIRPAGSDPGDQKRFMTPPEAIDRGASHLVIGRPITAAPDPVAAAEEILKSIG
jgi:orotidine-5'-phosphate decarboxylase